jgi:hypothetical protein
MKKITLQNECDFLFLEMKKYDIIFVYYKSKNPDGLDFQKQK